VAGGCRRLHNEEHHNLYAPMSIIRVIKSRRMRQTGHVACMGDMRNVYKILVRKPEGQRPLRRCRHKWEGNIVMDLRESSWRGVEWMHLAQDRGQRQAVVNMVMNLWVP
jgi:hypothetical protein